MVKIYKCDKCNKIKEVKSTDKYPKDWFLVKVFSRPAVKMKGLHSEGFHFCGKCKLKVFG